MLTRRNNAFICKNTDFKERFDFTKCLTLDNLYPKLVKSGFTLAEVLITLGIIGVISAMTIPTLITNIQKHVIETRLKDTYSILANALKLSENEFGVGFNPDNVDNSSWNKKSSKAVFDKYFRPFIKVNFQYPDADCVKLSENYSFSSSSKKYSDINGACYALMNGASIIFWAKKNAKFSPVMIIVNPNKKRKIAGRDVFALNFIQGDNGLYVGTVFNSLNVNLTDEELREYCISDADRVVVEGHWGGRYNFCTEIIKRNSWKIPDDYPIKL